MTQYMLCDPIRMPVADGVELRPIEDDPWLADAARALFPSVATVRVPYRAGGGLIHDLFTEAHDAVFNGDDFSGTRLSIVLPQMADRCRSFAVWWSDDWSDLPVVRTKADLISEVVRQL